MGVLGGQEGAAAISEVGKAQLEATREVIKEGSPRGEAST